MLPSRFHDEATAPLRAGPQRHRLVAARSPPRRARGSRRPGRRRSSDGQRVVGVVDRPSAPPSSENAPGDRREGEGVEDDAVLGEPGPRRSADLPAAVVVGAAVRARSPQGCCTPGRFARAPGAAGRVGRAWRSWSRCAARSARRRWCRRVAVARIWALCLRSMSREAEAATSPPTPLAERHVRLSPLGGVDSRARRARRVLLLAHADRPPATGRRPSDPVPEKPSRLGARADVIAQLDPGRGSVACRSARSIGRDGVTVFVVPVLSASQDVT